MSSIESQILHVFCPWKYEQYPQKHEIAEISWRLNLPNNRKAQDLSYYSKWNI